MGGAAAVGEAGAGLGLDLVVLLMVVVVVITFPPAFGVGDLGSLGPLTGGLVVLVLVVLLVVVPPVCLVTVVELILLDSEGAWLSWEPSRISRRKVRFEETLDRGVWWWCEPTEVVLSAGELLRSEAAKARWAASTSRSFCS